MSAVSGFSPAFWFSLYCLHILFVTQVVGDHKIYDSTVYRETHANNKCSQNTQFVFKSNE